MFVCQVFVWFVVYSVVGWVWESTYCTIVERRWQNRGFLYGPACPIYGTGIVGIMLLWHHALAQGTALSWWQVFLTMALGSAVLEYATHWALEKLFHAYWWDYSNMPLNLNGRICLPATIFFGLGGLLVVYVLYQPTVDMIAAANPLLTELLALVLMAVMAADAAVTASSLASIAHAASSINQSVNEHMDRFVLETQERGAQARHQLEEHREERAEAMRQAAESLRERSDAIVEEVRQREAERAAARARERERFAASLRSSHLGQMSALTRSAAQRAMGAVSPDHLPDTPEREQLARLWRDMLDRN